MASETEDQALAASSPLPGSLGIEPPRPSALVPTSRWRALGAVFGIGLALAAVAELLAPTYGIMGWIAFFFVYAATMRRRIFAVVGLFREVSAALDVGDVATATKHAAEMLKRAPFHGPYQLLAIAMWGLVELRRGQPESAAAILRPVAEDPVARGRIGRLMEMWWISGAYAMAEAVAGDTRVATRWIDDATTHAPASMRGRLLPIRVLVQCRSGEWTVALETIGRELRSAEGQLKPFAMRQIRLLEAFAREHVGESYRDDNADRTQRALEAAREAGRGAFDHLAVRWPELRTFLERHHLTVG